MGKTTLMEEFHVTVIMPVGLAKSRYAAAVRTLNNKRFQAKLRAAIRRIFREHPSLGLVQIKLSR